MLLLPYWIFTGEFFYESKYFKYFNDYYYKLYKEL